MTKINKKMAKFMCFKLELALSRFLKEISNFLIEKVYYIAYIISGLIMIKYGQVINCSEGEIQDLQEKHFVLRKSILMRFPQIFKSVKMETYMSDLSTYIDRDLVKFNSVESIERYSVFLTKVYYDVALLGDNLSNNCDIKYQEHKREILLDYTRRHFFREKKNYLGTNSWYGYYSLRNISSIHKSYVYHGDGIYQYDDLKLKRIRFELKENEGKF